MASISACVGASGRPVITMRTGFTSFCPVGEGVFDYMTHDEALAAIDAIAADYPRHSTAARDIAGACFGSEQVIGDMLRDARI